MTYAHRATEVRSGETVPSRYIRVQRGTVRLPKRPLQQESHHEFRRRQAQYAPTQMSPSTMPVYIRPGHVAGTQ